MDKSSHFKRLVIAAYRLPFNFKKTKKGYKAIQNSGGLVSSILALAEKFKSSNGQFNEEKIVWVGSIENSLGDMNKAVFENDNFQIIPVQIDEELFKLYSEGFCNDLIWPLFHYFPSFSVFDPEYFEAYKKANSRFCQEILKIVRPGDFVWVHDYQLMLLPRMIRKRTPSINAGFFLHIPFPSFEVFRLLPRKWRETLIRGLLGADLIGFHTHDYSQNFIKSVKRTLGYECNQNHIYAPDRLVKADAFPIGIDFEKFNTACKNNSVIIEKQNIKKSLSEHKLIFSIDRLDYSKGLLLKLKGYETFLEKYPEFHSRVVFNMVVVPSRDNISRYKEMKKDIEYTVGRINGEYTSLAWRPIIYQYKSLTFNELVALYDMSDVGLITPLRDGMNLVAKEYVACQVDNIGVLVLSEMTGAAAELGEAILINPVDTEEMAESIYNALTMNVEEKKNRINRMQARISNYNVFTWAFDFFNQAYDINLKQKLMSVKFVNNTIAGQIYADYKNAISRILFLDYDGTLVPFEKYPELATLDQSTLDLVNELSLDPYNRVVIISGRKREFLEHQFMGANVSLIAEHGYFIKHRDEQWFATVDSNPDWKDDVLPILTEYVSRCNGSFIEEKTGSLAWHYRNADTDFAELRLNELRDDLAEIIRHKTDYEILEGNKVLEIKNGRFDKGLAATSLINRGEFDFFLAVGDDKTDEKLFKAMPEGAYTIKIGLTPSLAKYNIADFTGLLSLLNSFVE